MGEDLVTRRIRLDQERRAKKEAEFTERSLAKQGEKIRQMREFNERWSRNWLRQRELLKVKIPLVFD
jgi:hypothetical protein